MCDLEQVTQFPFSYGDTKGLYHTGGKAQNDHRNRQAMKKDGRGLAEDTKERWGLGIPGSYMLGYWEGY